MVEYRLLEKTELRIKPVELHDADLGACARVAARVLGLKPDEIMVTDVLEDTMTLDVLVPAIQAEQIISRKKALLDALSSIPGVHIRPETEMHSDGILGFISLDEKSGQEVLQRTYEMGTEIEERIRKRSMVFATGTEVLAGQIRDTNTPFLIEALKAQGYNADRGPVLEDKTEAIARAFLQAAGDGYGLVISSGGIGAEGKDRTLEALGRVDPKAVLPYILKFHKGQGRHQKDGVRIGVGVIEQTRFICLPGPHDEVQMAWPVLIKGLEANWDKQAIADALANVLRQKFIDRSRHHQDNK